MNTIGKISEINFKIGEIFISDWTLSLRTASSTALMLFLLSFIYLQINIDLPENNNSKIMDNIKNNIKDNITDIFKDNIKDNFIDNIKDNIKDSNNQTSQTSMSRTTEANICINHVYNLFDETNQSQNKYGTRTEVAELIVFHRMMFSIKGCLP